MADKKISGLPSTSSITGVDLIPIVQGGITKQIEAVNFKIENIRSADHDVSFFTTTQTINLKTDVSVNIIVVSNPGLTLTLQLPTAPIEGQICQFTTLTNTVTLAVGTGGSFSVNPSFAGAPTAGFKATYCYHETDDTYYLIG